MLVSVPDMTPRADKEHIVRDDETETWRSDYAERRADVPQVLMVEQRLPGSKILAHFLHVPEERAKMPRGGKRFFMADYLPVRALDELRAPEVVSRLASEGVDIAATAPA